MIADALQWLRDRVEKEREVEIIKPRGAHSRRNTLIWPNGDSEEIMQTPPPLKRNVKTLESFVASAKLDDAGPNAGAVVYCQLGVIVGRPHEGIARCDDVPDDETVFMFDEHPLLKLCYQNPVGWTKDHKQTVRLLTVDFGVVQYEPSNLVDLLRVVNFSALSENESEQSREMEKVGKRLTAKVSGIDALPEMFSVTVVPSLHFPGLTPRTVEMQLQPLPSESAFRITPVAVSASKATADAEQEIVEKVAKALKAAGVSVEAVLAGSRA